MTGAYEFGTLVAVESSETRAAVERFAVKLHADQERVWLKHRDGGERNKAQPPSLEECRAKSRQIRRRREVDSRYWNDLVSRRPLH